MDDTDLPRDVLVSRLTPHSGKSGQRWLAEMSQPEKAGLFGITAGWLRSSSKRGRQLDTFTLPDMRVWGIEALEHLTPTRSHMTIKLNTAWLQLWGFWFLGSSDLPSIPTSDRSPQSP